MNTLLLAQQLVDSNPQGAAGYFAAAQLVQEAELTELAQQLADDPCCSRDDVLRLASLLEEHLSLQESLSVLSEID